MRTLLFDMDLNRTLSFVFTDKCIDEYLVHQNYLHGACFKAGLSKILGYGIIVGSSIVKVPQLLKLLLSRSAVGLDILSLLLELLTYTVTVAYSLNRKFPFSSYGEACFLSFQCFLITLLTITWEKSNFLGGLFVGFYVLFGSCMLSPNVPPFVLFSLQTINLPVMIASKLIQCWTNWSNRSTGQLSAITILLITLGSLARIFTSIQETGDYLMVLTYVAAFSCNLLQTAQLFLYWNSPTQPISGAKKRN